MVHLEARLLHDLVNREIHPIRCAESCRRKAQVALRLGDLCEEAGHPWWALKVWMMACQLIADRDYDEWIGVWFNTDWVRLSHVVAEEWCLDLGRRIDALWGRLGHPEMGWWEAIFQDGLGCVYPQLVFRNEFLRPYGSKRQSRAILINLNFNHE